VQVLCSIDVNQSHEKSSDKKEKKKKKKGFLSKMFTKVFGQKKKVLHDDGTESQEEDEAPKFIYSQDFAGSTDVYKKPFTSKDIKSIYKRLAD